MEHRPLAWLPFLKISKPNLYFKYEAKTVDGFQGLTYT